MGENDVACARLHRNTNHDGNTDGKNNDALQSYETPCRGIPFFLFLVIQLPAQPHHNLPNCLDSEKNI